MATADSYCAMYDPFLNRTNQTEAFHSALSGIANEVGLNLGCVKVCLTLGPGEGLYEIEFLQKCAENVGNLIAVERDRESAERLRARLRESLPNVVATVIETDFHTWKGPEDQVDVVLLFHVLYYFSTSERKEFLRKLHDYWLSDGGFVVVQSVSGTESPGHPNQKMFRRLGSPIVAWEDIEADLLDVGFIKNHAYEFQVETDFSDPDESYLRFFQQYCLYVGQRVTLDDVRNAIKELYPHGKTDRGFDTLAVFTAVANGGQGQVHPRDN